MSDEKQCETLWVWVTEVPGDGVSQVAAILPGTDIMGTLSSRKKPMALMMRSIAEAHGRAMGQPVWLREYEMVRDYYRGSKQGDMP